ncbi:Kinesin-like protein KIN-7L [Diplonema papillatum]|nr:Kinesin-like protein KIN-7L [Diplonema papillatum]
MPSATTPRSAGGREGSSRGIAENRFLLRSYSQATPRNEEGSVDESRMPSSECDYARSTAYENSEVNHSASDATSVAQQPTRSKYEVVFEDNREPAMPTDQSVMLSVGVRIRPPEDLPHTTKRPGQGPRSQRKAAGVSADGKVLFDGANVKWKWTPASITKASEAAGPAAAANAGQRFTFSKVYAPGDTTQQVYNGSARDTVKKFLDGYNGCVFAYGQTNSGKTHTMLGSQQCPGIIPLACVDVFNAIQKRNDLEKSACLVRVAFLEVYNEQLKDLLSTGAKGPALTIGEDPDRGVIVQGITEYVASCLDDVLDAVKYGEAKRAAGRNRVHEHASRSHSVFQITLETRDFTKQEVVVRTLSLVDLAGSEANYQTQEATPADVLTDYKELQTIAGRLARNDAGEKEAQMKEREGSNIRRSLTALVRVVQVLSSSKLEHIPYRDSKLTRLLQPALGGSSHTSIICTINPVEEKETTSTLRFATAAQKVHNRPKTVTMLTEKALLGYYEESVKDLQKDLVHSEKANGDLAENLRKEQTSNERTRRELARKKAEADSLKKKVEGMSRFLLGASGLSTTLANHYDVDVSFGGGLAEGAPAAGEKAKKPCNPTRRRARSMVPAISRDAKSKDMFDSRTPSRPARAEEAVSLLALSNSAALAETHQSAVRAALDAERTRAKALAAQLEDAHRTLSQSDSGKDRLIAELQAKIAGLAKKSEEEAREKRSLEAAHEAALLQAEGRLADAVKQRDSEAERARRSTTTEEQREAEMAELRGRAEAAEARARAAAERAEAVAKFAARAEGERLGFYRMIEAEEKGKKRSGGGCSSAPSAPPFSSQQLTMRVKRFCVGADEVTRLNPVLTRPTDQVATERRL